jgi:GT2 family glycosyltransferase
MGPYHAEAMFHDPRRHRAALALLAAECLQRGDVTAAFRFADRLCRLCAPSARDLLLRAEAARRGGFAEEASRDLSRALALDPVDGLVLRQALVHGDAGEKTRAAAWLDCDADAPSKNAPAPPSGVSGAGTPGPDAEDILSVVVPVYEDFDSARACFEALFAESRSPRLHVVAVDDASPNAPLRDWLDAQAGAGRLTLLRNPRNLGFAASVNRALEYCSRGDVVLLNADALPPPGSLARLGAIARSSPDIGTVTPMSNNGEYASFPAPFVANPLPPPEEIARIDALAHKANGAAFVDLPNGIGFCLYIVQVCLDAVGPLPEIYERGYFEDVEFCLRAREKGFRNVCAPGVYVGHAGARSFGIGKRRLVVRNLATLERRFPDYPLESACFVEADPLRAARGAIEALSPNESPTVLLVCAGGASQVLARERAKDLAERGATPLVCACGAGGRIALRGAEGVWPQSLAFASGDKAGLAALIAYLRATPVTRVELFDPLSLPASLLTPLFRLGAPVEIIGGDLEWNVALRTPRDGACATPGDPSLCPACARDAFSSRADAGAEAPRSGRKRHVLARAKKIRPLDRMAEAFAREIFGAALVPPLDEPAIIPTPLPRAARADALAIVVPMPDPLVDRLIIALGRALRLRGVDVQVVVLGGCADDLAVMASGNVFVAGPVATEEYEPLLRQYGAMALMSPSRTRFFGTVDRLARRFGLPQAGFDYSMGRLTRSEGDLALDPRLCDAKAASLAADWLTARIAAGRAP